MPLSANKKPNPIVGVLTACSNEGMSRTDRKIFWAVRLDKNFATCPCGERIKLDTNALPRKVAKDTYRIAHLVAVICPKCLSGVKIDLIAA